MFEWSKSLLNRFSLPDKKIPTLNKISYLTPPPTGTGDFSPTPLTLFGKPWHVENPSRDVEIISTYFSKGMGF